MEADAEKHEMRKPVLIQVTAWILMLLLLGASVGLSFLPLGGYRIAIHLGAAAAMAALVAVFFMSLRNTSTVVRILALSALIWLALLLVYSYVDYLSR